MKLIAGGAVAVVLVIGLIAVTTSPRENAAMSHQTATIVLEDLRFVPNRIDAKVGVAVTLVLTNRGTERHDLNFPSRHMPGLQGVQAILEPGEVRTIALTFDQPGIHSFICTLPGHSAAGMSGAAYVAP